MKPTEEQIRTATRVVEAFRADIRDLGDFNAMKLLSERVATVLAAASDAARDAADKAADDRWCKAMETADWDGGVFHYNGQIYPWPRGFVPDVPATWKSKTDEAHRSGFFAGYQAGWAEGRNEVESNVNEDAKISYQTQEAKRLRKLAEAESATHSYDASLAALKRTYLIYLAWQPDGDASTFLSWAKDESDACEQITGDDEGSVLARQRVMAPDAVVEAVRTWARAECGVTQADAVLSQLTAYDDALVAPHVTTYACVDCSKPITDGIMEGAGNGTGQRFRHRKGYGCHAKCENCGMVDVPLKDGFCNGCTCSSCGAHGSMDAGGMCSDVLFSYKACQAKQAEKLVGG